MEGMGGGRGAAVKWCKRGGYRQRPRRRKPASWRASTEAIRSERSRSRRVLGIVLAVAFGATAMLAAFGGRPVENVVAGVVVSLAYWVLLEAGIAIHEAGHVLAGRLIGFRFVEC